MNPTNEPVADDRTAPFDFDIVGVKTNPDGTIPDRTEAAPKPSATDGAGSPVLPSHAMDATDAAIVNIDGGRADIARALAAERRAWNQYATDLARQVIRETLAELTK